MGVQAGKTARYDGLAKRASIVRGLIQTAQRTRLRALQRQRVKPATIGPRLHAHADRRAVACRRVIGAVYQARACSSVDRVLASEARGRGFESRQARHQRSSTTKRFLHPHPALLCLKLALSLYIPAALHDAPPENA